MNAIAASALVALLFAAQAFPQAPVHILASNGVKAVLEQLKPQCERAIGHPLSIEFGTTASLKTKIAAGAAFDATVLTTEGVDELLKSGNVNAATRAGIARCGVGVGIRQGAPKPDISTPAALKQSLTKAKSIVYVRTGASRPFIEAMAAHFGITDQLKAKTQFAPGSTEAGEAVAKGQGEVLITLISEIIPVHGVELVGPLPSEVQGYVNFSAAAAAHTQNGEAAAKFVHFLASPSAAPAYKSNGMEPR